MSDQEIFSQKGAGLVTAQPFDMQAFGQYGSGRTASTLKQRDYKDATDLVVAIHDKATRHKGGGDDRQNDGSGNGLGIAPPDSPMYTLTGGDKHAVCTPSTIRRLTPTECERLQGFPDGHTQIPWRGKPIADCPDGHRYKAIGNSKAVPVIKWIGERIADAIQNGTERP